ncbi:hypothetical protein [Enterococcus sp. DIV0800]|uniref:hypothetical protein n=1 Tax=unclassified Enterococcus TaxID=2608891 RepID=UPI003D3005C2
MENKSEKVELHHLFWKKHSHQIPIDSLGTKKYHIKVEKGTVNINHFAFSRDSGCWIDIPKSTKEYPHHHQITAGEERIIEFKIHHVLDRVDRVFITNYHLFKKAIVQIIEVE